MSSTIDRVLVTGATGLLGGHIVSSLLEQGYQVNALIRSERNKDLWAKAGVQIFHGSLEEHPIVSQALRDCQAVIHAAALTSQRHLPFEQFLRVNVDPTRMLLELCQEQGIKRFVYVSTANCFAYGNSGSPGTEENKPNEWMLDSGYIRSKYLAQQLVLNAAGRLNFPAVVVNPTFIIGKEKDVLSSNAIFRLLKMPLILAPPGGKNFVDARLAATACVQALTQGDTGTCYLISGTNKTYVEFYREALRQRNQRKPIWIVPGNLLRITGRLAFRLSRWIHYPTSLTPWNMRLLTEECYYAGVKAHTELGLTHSRLPEMIGAYYASLDEVND